MSEFQNSLQTEIINDLIKRKKLRVNICVRSHRSKRSKN
jgi:hypothetical protein